MHAWQDERLAQPHSVVHTGEIGVLKFAQPAIGVRRIGRVFPNRVAVQDAKFFAHCASRPNRELKVSTVMLDKAVTRYLAHFWSIVSTDYAFRFSLILARCIYQLSKVGGCF
jgi:hypothetical protein